MDIRELPPPLNQKAPQGLRSRKEGDTAALDFPASGMIVSSPVLEPEQQLRNCQFILVLVLACSPCGEGAFAAKRPEKPSKPPAVREMICQLQSPCRPVREGCHLERVGQYNEEVCKQGGGRTP